MVNIRKLESELWEAADLLRSDSKLTSNEYCMPVLGLIFLRYAYSRFKLVEAEILKSRPTRGGRAFPIEKNDFQQKSAIFLPKEAQYEYLVNLPENILSANIQNKEGNTMTTLGEVVNNAMLLIEEQKPQLTGVLPKSYTEFSDQILSELLRIFNNSALNDVDGDIIGRIYEYFLNKFAKNIASDDGVFFTPKSLVKMIVNVIEPTHGILLDPACGSGGMFVQSGDFVNQSGMNANNAMTFYGQEKVKYNSQLCLMNMAVHGLSGAIKSGDEANTFYHDAHNLNGCCDYVMANPPFNVDKVKSETCASAGRLPFGMPAVNKTKEVGNANYLWISYFYSYLNEKGRAGFVMAASATDSQSKDKDIRQALVESQAVDVMISVGNNFFYTKSLPCSLWFFDKDKKESIKNRVLFIDARNYYTVVDRTLNEWSEWQIQNLNAIVWLYRGETEKYKILLEKYKVALSEAVASCTAYAYDLLKYLTDKPSDDLKIAIKDFQTVKISLTTLNDMRKIFKNFREAIEDAESLMLKIHEATSESERKAAARSLNLSGYKALEKKLEILTALAAEEIEKHCTVIDEASWLYNKFGKGEYTDVLGLCKLADIDEIAAKGWSLTPGAYVGVAPVEDDGTDFKKRMREIHEELLSLQAESNDLMDNISQNMKEMGL